MKTFKKSLAVILSFFMILSLASCTSKTTNTTTAESSKTVKSVTLKVWVPVEELNITKTMCENFAKQHPEVKFTFNYGVMGVDKSIDQLKKDASAGADVFFYPSGGIPELTAAGLILPITYKADEVKNENSSTAINSCSKDGKLYGVPETPNSWFMYYNKSMYSEDDVKSLDKMMAKDLGNGIKNFSVDLSNSWYNAAWFYGAGCTLFGKSGTDSTKCDWNSATGVAVGNYLLRLSRNPKFVNDTSNTIGGSLFESGKLGAICSGTWSAADFKKALGDNYAATVLPTFNLNGKECQLRSFVDYKAIGVNAVTKYPQEAEELAVYLGNADCQLMRFKQLNVAPTVKSLLDDPSVKANVEVSALAKQASLYSVPQPQTPQLANYWDPSNAFGRELINGNINSANMQSKLDALVKAITTSTVK